MAYGFNAGERYITELPKEGSRRYMMELKLKAAHKLGYPFFGVSPRDFEPLAADLAWSIVDGVIGSVLAEFGLMRLLSSWLSENDRALSPESLTLSPRSFSRRVPYAGQSFRRTTYLIPRPPLCFAQHTP
jgi:hypothetical protein